VDAKADEGAHEKTEQHQTQNLRVARVRLVHRSRHIIATDAVFSLGSRFDYKFLFKLTLISGKASAFYNVQ